MLRATLSTLLALPLCAQPQGEGITLLSKLDTKAGYGGIWGHTSEAGRELALVGANEGLWVVDVTEPKLPREIALFPAPSNRWREVTCYKHWVYEVSEGHLGLRVIDLANLAAPRDLGLVHTGDWGNAHTISVDADKGRLYVNGTGHGMFILDAKADPANPPVLGVYTADFVHDSHHRRGRSYLSHYYTGKLRIVDSTNPQQLVQLGVLTTPGATTHDAWISDDDRFLLTTDENVAPQAGYLQAYDLATAGSPLKLGSYAVPGHVVHTVTMVNRAAYVAWHTDGFHVVDFTDPKALRRLARFDTSSATGALDGAWGGYPFFDSGTVVVSDAQEGLFCLQVDVGHMNRFGAGVAGSLPRPPKAQLAGATPAVGASAFALEVVDLAPNQPFAVALSSDPGSLTIGPYTLHIGLARVLALQGRADDGGHARVSLPIPKNALLAGRRIWLQVLAVDPGALYGLIVSRGHWFGIAPV
jgi:choice-of-anchor B domain-containing protein